MTLRCLKYVTYDSGQRKMSVILEQIYLLPYGKAQKSSDSGQQMEDKPIASRFLHSGIEKVDIPNY